MIRIKRYDNLIGLAFTKSSKARMVFFGLCNYFLELVVTNRELEVWKMRKITSTSSMILRKRGIIIPFNPVERIVRYQYHVNWQLADWKFNTNSSYFFGIASSALVFFVYVFWAGILVGFAETPRMTMHAFYLFTNFASQTNKGFRLN